MSKHTTTVKDLTMDDVTEAPQEQPEPTDTESVAQQFIFREPHSRPVPRELSPDEQHRRELQRRFKKVRGYKPIEKNLEKLTEMVVHAEMKAGIYEDK